MTIKRMNWITIKRRARSALAGLAAWSVAACSTVPAAAEAPRPALWKLADADTTIYLFGTFHLLPGGHRWRTPAIDAALSEADELVLEIGNLDDKAQAQAMAETMAKLAASPNLAPLLERVPADKRDDLNTMIKSSGIPMAALDKLETWAAAWMLMAVMFKQLGVSSKAGVEVDLSGPARAAGKPIVGLETVEQQLAIFDQLPEETQRYFLVSVLDDPARTRAQFQKMLASWTRGDLEAFAATFNEDINRSPELQEALLERRNARWADWLAERLERPGTAFVAVGAAHLAGPGSVHEMLAEKGLKARRVQ
jgi:uncharacterized protein YbaP (TraB family)